MAPKEFTFRVRETPPCERFPKGVPAEMVSAVYDDFEQDYMRDLSRRIERAPEGSDLRAELLNELHTLHEFKALLPGVRLLPPKEEVALGLRDADEVVLAAEPVQQSQFFDKLPGIVQESLMDPDENRIGKFSDPALSGAPETQRKAAIKVYPRTGTYRRGVLDAIGVAGERGLLDEDLYVITGWDENTVRPRRNELMNDGWIEDSGRRRMTPSGKEAVVWVLTEQGKREWRGATKAAPA